MLGINPTEIERLQGPPRIGFCRPPHWEDASHETRTLIEDAANRLSRAGANVSDFDLPHSFDDAMELHHRVSRFEVGNCLTFEAMTESENLSASALGSIEVGSTVSFDEYLSGIRRIETLRHTLVEMQDDVDVLLTPRAPGEAPLGLGFTGPVPFNYLWTLMHTPAVTVPAFTGAMGLPIGVQVIGRRWDDDRTLAVADWVARSLR